VTTARAKRKFRRAFEGMEILDIVMIGTRYYRAFVALDGEAALTHRVRHCISYALLSLSLFSTVLPTSPSCMSITSRQVESNVSLRYFANMEY
jgi:hypothetical protein